MKPIVGWLSIQGRQGLGIASQAKRRRLRRINLHKRAPLEIGAFVFVVYVKAGMDRWPPLRLAAMSWRTVRLLAASLVLLAIAFDVAADVRCNTVTRESVIASVQPATTGGQQDPCNTGCVPDCFCCSTLFPSPVPPPLDVAGPAVALATPADLRFDTGVRPLPYHPPLASVLS